MTRTPIRLAIDPAAITIMAPDSFQDNDEQPLPRFPGPETGNS
ncbi:MAG TPA: hypothetical protein VN429_09655 [Methanospirillum sp.]|nr:hypothetical protein [Methanospirillum sp.]HWQ64666.1 hypothetical protein [Methanospirillum sp.]